MKEEELATIRLKMRIEVRSIALESLAKWAQEVPGGRQALAAWAAGMRAQAQSVTVGKSPVYSDLLAAEYQEALQEMLGGLGL